MENKAKQGVKLLNCWGWLVFLTLCALLNSSTKAQQRALTLSCRIGCTVRLSSHVLFKLEPRLVLSRQNSRWRPERQGSRLPRWKRGGKGWGVLEEYVTLTPARLGIFYLRWQLVKRVNRAKTQSRMNTAYVFLVWSIIEHWWTWNDIYV